MRHWWHDVWEFHHLFQGPPLWQLFVGPVHNGLWTMLWVLSGLLGDTLAPPRPPWSYLIRQPGVLFFQLTIALILMILLLMIVCQCVSMENMETWGLTVFGLALALFWIAAVLGTGGPVPSRDEIEASRPSRCSRLDHHNHSEQSSDIPGVLVELTQRDQLLSRLTHQAAATCDL